MGGPTSGRSRNATCLHELCKLSINEVRLALDQAVHATRLEHCYAVVGAQSLKVIYAVRGKHVWHDVTIAYTAPTYGGQRAWLCCPHCGHRRNDLYFNGGMFVCRVCSGLRYRSEGESYSARMRRRWLGIAHLVLPTATLPTFPERPKGMSSKRYDRLKAQADDLEYRYVKNTDLHARVDSIEAGRYQKLR